MCMFHIFSICISYFLAYLFHVCLIFCGKRLLWAYGYGNPISLTIHGHETLGRQNLTSHIFFLFVWLIGQLRAALDLMF